MTRQGHDTHSSSRPGRTCLRVQESKLRWQTWWLASRDYHDLLGFHKSIHSQNLPCVLFFYFLVFLGPYPQHMEVPRPGVETELQLSAYTTATATRDPSHICDLHHSSRQCWILNPLSEARDWTCVLMVTSQICFPLSSDGNAHLYISTWRTLLSISYKAGRPSKYPLAFVCSGKPVLFSFLKDSFSRYCLLGWQVFYLFFFLLIFWMYHPVLKSLSFLKIYFIEVYLISSIVLISSVQHSDSFIYIHTFFFIFFSMMVYPRILHIVPCATQ